jgi:predicted amidophosphoribosyltransferase
LTAPARPPRRLRREERTIAAMVGLYCRDHHAGGDALCEECTALLDYARKRLAHCRYGVDKPTCAHCPGHCYKPAMREQIRVVMRYSGPRMAQRHPLLAAAHLLDRRKAPAEE